MAPRASYTWHCRDREHVLGAQSVVMGILNVTPDSFSDGGAHDAPKAAVDHAHRMIGEGAEIIDIGGESTRPGANPVRADEEIARVLPVIEQLVQTSDITLSIDTTKSEVADAALDAGAHIVNDVSGFTLDPDMAGVAARYGAGVVLMHMQGIPRTMQDAPVYEDVVTDVREALAARLAEAQQAGVRLESLCIDPGIGFGKTLDHNLELLAGLPALAALGCPILVGLSRKSFIGKITGADVADRLTGSLAAATYAIGRGAHILRVHDVKDSCEVARIADILLQKESMLE